MSVPENIRVVLDTNVVLYALSPQLHYKTILQKAIQGEYEWWVTTEILLEYEEKVEKFFGTTTANTLIEAILLSSYTRKADVFFRFNLLNDPDDNKFIDCAFAANAHYLVSEDKGFSALENLEFPKINWIKADSFLEILNDDGNG